jgi:hypothetical protein
MFGVDDAITGGLNLAGGLFGMGEEASARRRAREAMLQGIGTLQGADVEAGNAWQDAVEDPAGRTAQLRALAQLQDIGDQRGMDVGSKAAFQEAAGESAMREKAQRDAAEQGMRARGFGGSGAGFASALSGAQGGANSLAGAGAIFASQARQRALDAIKGGAQVGGQVRQGDADFQGRKLNATNLVNVFNAGQRWSKAQGVAGGYRDLAGVYTGQGQRANANLTAAGQAAGAAGAGMYGFLKDQPENPYGSYGARAGAGVGGRY